MNLDLRKNDFMNFQKFELDKPIYVNVQQNISRAWKFLKLTHNINQRECICIRALASPTNENDEWCAPEEHIIFNFSDESYKDFEDFIISKIRSKRIYNFFYNIYNINIRRGKETSRENQGGMFGKSCNISNTSMIICDFDNFSVDDYRKLKKDFINKGLNGTLDICSGHGFHICFRLNENSDDELLLLKFIKILQENGYNPDACVFDPARVMRLPGFWNYKPQYEKVALSEIADGEYSSRTFTIDEIFEKFGFSYKKFDLEKYYEKKKAGRHKKEKKQKTTVELEFDDNVHADNYDIDTSILPEGVQNMLHRGFIQGYTNLMVMFLTIFFKTMGLNLIQIQNIMEEVESINGLNDNNWELKKEVERFYEKYDFVSKYVIMELQSVFGEIRFINSKVKYRIPVGINSKHTELYLFLLQNNNSRKVDILEGMNISNNKLDRIMEDNKLVNLDNRIYSISKDLKFDNYIVVNGFQLAKLSKLNDKELEIYIYLKYRCNKDKNKISIENIKEYTGISAHTISDTLKKLEKKKLIKVTRWIYDTKTNSKKVNEYKIL